jgi:hypothetical protein
MWKKLAQNDFQKMLWSCKQYRGLVEKEEKEKTFPTPHNPSVLYSIRQHIDS